VQSPRHLRQALQADLCPHSLCLYVRWHSAAGGVKVNRLPLDPIGGVADLRGLFRRLIQGAFGSPAALPDYLTSPSFYKFSPAEELISLPADIARTEFRLAVTLNGWEYTVCERTLPGTPDPDRKLLVTVRWAREGGCRAAVAWGFGCGYLILSKLYTRKPASSCLWLVYLCCPLASFAITRLPAFPPVRHPRPTCALAAGGV
jgi:hypothetical protein